MNPDAYFWNQPPPQTLTFSVSVSIFDFASSIARARAVVANACFVSSGMALRASRMFLAVMRVLKGATVVSSEAAFAAEFGDECRPWTRSAAAVRSPS